MTQPLDLRVDVDTVPEPGLLRPAIEAALAVRPWPPGPEAQIAAAVSAAVGARAPSTTTPSTTTPSTRTRETPAAPGRSTRATAAFRDGAETSRRAGR